MEGCEESVAGSGGCLIDNINVSVLVCSKDWMDTFRWEAEKGAYLSMYISTWNSAERF